MSATLNGEVALVTGGSRGIGRGIAASLAAAGAEVVLTARTAEGAERAAAEIGETGGKVRGVAMDVRDDDGVAEGVKELIGHYGRISILVNNAGITRDNLLLRLKKEDWDSVLETNLTGIYRLCRAVLPAMVRKRYGRIVNITSVVASSGNPGQSNYAAAKAGTEGFTRSLALEVASRNITVNCIAPGFVDTDMTRELDDKARGKLLELVPIKRLGTPEDVAGAVRFLVGPDAAYITGLTLEVNGGMNM